MVSQHPIAPVGEGSGDGAELPQFALVTALEDADNHALAPSTEGGPALCGLEPPAAGWFPAGCTSRLYQIDCHGCRERAAAVLARLSEPAADPSKEVGNG
jgi:hypothetical protein